MKYRVVLWFLAEMGESNMISDLPAVSVWGPNVICDVHAGDVDDAVQKVMRWYSVESIDGATVFCEDGTSYTRGHVGQIKECRALVPYIPG
jgi:hypothetical protein